MKSVYNFVVKPKGERYNNTKKFEGGELILNTEIYNHQFVNRTAIVDADNFKVDHVEEALEDDDEICVRNPIIFNFAIEY